MCRIGGMCMKTEKINITLSAEELEIIISWACCTESEWGSFCGDEKALMEKLESTIKGKSDEPN